MCPCPKLFEVPTRFSHTDDRHIEVATFKHGLQSWENFLVGQIARGTEEDQGVGMGTAHPKLSFPRTVIYRLLSPSVHRSRSASLRAACPDNPPHRAR